MKQIFHSLFFDELADLQHDERIVWNSMSRPVFRPEQGDNARVRHAYAVIRST